MHGLGRITLKFCFAYRRYIQEHSREFDFGIIDNLIVDVCGDFYARFLQWMWLYSSVLDVFQTRLLRLHSS